MPGSHDSKKTINIVTLLPPSIDSPWDFYRDGVRNIKRIETMKGKNKSHGKIVGIALLFAITMLLGSIATSVAAAGDTVLWIR